MSLSVDNVTFGYGRQAILHDVSLTAAAGEVVGLLGPNGSGKSTLGKLVARILRLRHGSLRHDGVDLLALSRREHAKIVGYVPQMNGAPFELTVRENVLLGRTPHIGLRPTADDWRLVDEALALLDLEDLQDRPMSQLSGGQAQRVIVARAVAQQPRVLVLDEPTSALDLRHQIETLRLVRKVARRDALAVVIAVHDLNHAARYCDRVAFLRAGEIVAEGTPSEIYSPLLIEHVYGLAVQVDRSHRHVEVRPTESVDDVATTTNVGVRS